MRTKCLYITRDNDFILIYVFELYLYNIYSDSIIGIRKDSTSNSKTRYIYIIEIQYRPVVLGLNITFYNK